MKAPSRTSSTAPPSFPLGYQAPARPAGERIFSPYPLYRCTCPDRGNPAALVLFSRPMIFLYFFESSPFFSRSSRSWFRPRLRALCFHRSAPPLLGITPTANRFACSSRILLRELSVARCERDDRLHLSDAALFSGSPAASNLAVHLAAQNINGAMFRTFSFLY